MKAFNFISSLIALLCINVIVLATDGKSDVSEDMLNTSAMAMMSTAPATPVAPTISYNCGYTGISYSSGANPSGIFYYFQGTNSNGTSTSQMVSYPGGMVKVTSPGRYYIRAWNFSTGVWSTSSRAVDINTVKEKPSTPGIDVSHDYVCGNTLVTFTETNASNYTATWRFNGVNTAANENYINYWVRKSQNQVTLTYRLGTCTSTKTVTVPAYDQPPTPVIESGESEVCGNTDVSFIATPHVSGYIYNWSNEGGTLKSGQEVDYNINLYSQNISLTITDGQCSSTTTTKHINFLEKPEEPIIIGEGYQCGSEAATLKIENYNTYAIRWYEGNSLKTVNEVYTFDVPDGTSKTFTARRINNYNSNCYSSADITVQGLFKPEKPIIEDSWRVGSGSMLFEIDPQGNEITEFYIEGNTYTLETETNTCNLHYFDAYKDPVNVSARHIIEGTTCESDLKTIQVTAIPLNIDVPEASYDHIDWYDKSTLKDLNETPRYFAAATEGEFKFDIDVAAGIEWSIEYGDEYDLLRDPIPESGVGPMTVTVPHIKNAAGVQRPVIYIKWNDEIVRAIYIGKDGTNTLNRKSSLNYVESTIYGESECVKAQSIQYYDLLGKPTQSLTRAIEANEVLVSETLYDDFGRASLTTMSIPVDQQELTFVGDFIDRDNYGVNDDHVVVSSNTSAGLYYNVNNADEPYVPEDLYPFSTVEYSQTFPGTVLNSYAPGSGIQGKSAYSFAVAASPDELYNHPLSGLVNLKTLTKGTHTRNDFIGMTKSVTRDVMGKEAVIYYDAEGNAVASCMSSASVNLGSVADMVYTIDVGNGIDYIDIHLPAGQSSYTLTKTNAWQHTVRNLIDDEDLQTNSNLEITLPAGFYRIICKNDNGFTGIDFKTKLGYKYYSFSAYDNAGRLVRTLSPEHAVQLADADPQPTDITPYISLNKYNVLGWLTKSYSPDEGETNYLYCKDGKIRFSQNAVQKDEAKFSYTNYDTYGRVIEVGECSEYTNVSFSGITDVDGLVLNKAYCSDTTTTYYDIPDPDAPRAQNNTWGNVVKTENANTTTWYSYNHDESIDWAIQDIIGLGIKTIDYKYNFTGTVAEVVYQKGASDEFTHYYEYDFDNRLERVYTKGYNTEKTLQAKYKYYKHGPLKRVELAENLQGIDYVYTINGLLKSINNANSTHPDADPGKDGSGDSQFQEDIFTMGLDYYAGDYTRAGRLISTTSEAANFDGNIAAQHWRNKGFTEQGLDGHQSWLYTYDERNYLSKATYGIYNYTNGFTADLSNKYNVYGSGSNNSITYDANGNIQSLIRNGSSGSVMDQFTYNYNSQQLSAEPEQVNRLNYVGGLGSQSGSNYTYNKIGQLTKDIYGKDGTTQHLFEYDVYGKATKIDVDEEEDTPLPLVEYKYDDRGFRVKKIDYSNFPPVTTTYVRDINGSILATYLTEEAETNLMELPVYGSGRIGLANVSSGNIHKYTYELTDHLGNVRATVAKDGNGAPDVLYAADYYPFGMEMPERVYTGEGYRFGYQGQFAEKDDETGYNQFELRLYDNRIGRWLTTDPYRQYWSPYLGMGNNPMIMIDPDGGNSEIIEPVSLEDAQLTKAMITFTLGTELSSFFKFDNETFVFDKINPKELKKAVKQRDGNREFIYDANTRAMAIGYMKIVNSRAVFNVKFGSELFSHCEAKGVNTFQVHIKLLKNNDAVNAQHTFHELVAEGLAQIRIAYEYRPDGEISFTDVRTLQKLKAGALGTKSPKTNHEENAIYLKYNWWNKLNERVIQIENIYNRKSNMGTRTEHGGTILNKSKANQWPSILHP